MTAARAVCFPLSPVVAEWLAFHYGKPALFPPRSWENALLCRYACRRATACNGVPPLVSVAAVRPLMPGRPAAKWRGLTRAGQRALREAVEAAFVVDLYNAVFPAIRAGRGINAAVWEYCRRNGISAAHAEAVRMRLYRRRKEAQKHGVSEGAFRGAYKGAREKRKRRAREGRRQENGQ